jgi:hypothetical protein
MARFDASLSILSVIRADRSFVRNSMSRIAVWTNFAHVASVFSRTHLTFNDRHLSQDTVFDWLFLGAILETHLADQHQSVFTLQMRSSVKATTKGPRSSALGTTLTRLYDPCH